MDDAPLTHEAKPEETSLPYVNRWNGLVSKTNWEKGRIILQWRESLVAVGASPQEYSDEAWCGCVGGNLSRQHVGRLRRVWERFGHQCEAYEGVFWSHFYAALEWNDSEMWLEGVAQNGWSVSAMCRKRWEALGAPADKKPRDEDIVSTELDEDFSEPADGDVQPLVVDEHRETIGSGESIEEDAANSFEDETVPISEETAPEMAPVAQASPPLANLGELPADLLEAFEDFKLAIVRHKMDGWREVSLEDILSTLDALKELAQAPATE